MSKIFRAAALELQALSGVLHVKYWDCKTSWSYQSYMNGRQEDN